MYRRKDVFYRRAKAVGYRSRAAFKLVQLSKRARLFRPGDRVVDLGAWPGGWLQVASQQVGSTGKVVAVDMRRIENLPAPNVEFVPGDVTDEVTQEQVLTACGRKADVILSDLAPSLSGIRARDEAQASALVDCVLQFAERALRPGGKLVIKLFVGNDLAAAVLRLRHSFESVRTTRPEATRQGSSEVYAIATCFRCVAHEDMR